MNFINKKIGIWGFGIVGQSALNYFKQHTNFIQILDKNQIDHPSWIQQTDLTIKLFLEHNDFILASPGIPLHNYQKFKQKFITELDIFEKEFKGTSIAITGTLGKTSITNLLQQCIPESIAAGNIGWAMLNVVTDKPETQKVILEVSSFQLQYTKSFTPSLSIWTNFYPNHLDHHQSEKEYFLAKCNLIKHQTPEQITLLPCNLINKINRHINIKARTYVFCNCTITYANCSFLMDTSNNIPTFSIKNKNIIFNDKLIFQNITQLSSEIFLENWLIIIAALHLQNIPLYNAINVSQKLTKQEHRLENIGTFHGSTFYNDSKSTVWQATKQALEQLGNKPCALFLGGLSKGTNRSPLIQYLATKNITVFAFGKEAQAIKNLCNQHNVLCKAYENLDKAFYNCIKNNSYKNILLSPSGASFDLFKNYKKRGDYFKELVKKSYKT